MLFAYVYGSGRTERVICTSSYFLQEIKVY